MIESLTNQFSSLQMAAVKNKIAMRVVVKTLEAEQEKGEAMLRLVRQAASPSAKGRHLDRLA